jgi:hypothetical protein
MTISGHRQVQLRVLIRFTRNADVYASVLKAREDMKKPLSAPDHERCMDRYDRTPPMALTRESPFPSEADSPYRKTLSIALACILVSGPGSLVISDHMGRHLRL